MTTLQVQKGDVIRAYDFKPMQGREDCFIEGEVLDTNNTEQGYQAYNIRVVRDSWSGRGFPDKKIMESAGQEMSGYSVWMRMKY